MREKNRSTKKGQNHQGEIVEAPHELSGKIRYGAPDGPRPEGTDNYDGHTPIKWPGLETVAQYLVAPNPLREFKSDNDLAKHFDVTRMTINRWKHHPDVSKRVYWLSSRNRLAGELLARIYWPQIVQKLVERAMKGDTQAIKRCEEIAWRKEKQEEKSEISPWSLDEVIVRAEEERMKTIDHFTPSWILQKREDEKLGDSIAPIVSDTDEELPGEHGGTPSQSITNGES
jgi:hypothetical protein